MTKKILDNNWIKAIFGIIIYLLIVYETEAQVYDIYTWMLLPFILLAFNKIKLYNKEYFKTSIIISFFYSLMVVIGKIIHLHMFDVIVYTEHFITNKVIVLLLTWLFVYILSINVFEALDRFEVFEKKNIKKTKTVFIITAIIIVLSRIPYFLALYPGAITSDALSELGLFIQPKAALTNHHPLIHVLFMYIPYNIGMFLFHNVNSAVATITFTQIIVTSLIIAYIITYLYKLNVKNSYIVIALLFYALLPVNNYYAVTLWKDILFSYLVTLLIINIYYLYKEYYDNKAIKNKTLFSFAIISFLCLMFRNNAIYAYVFVIAAILLCFRREVKKLLITMSSVIVVYLIILIPIFNIIGVVRSSSSEYIAIPLQQVGRMAYFDVNFTTEEEKNITKLIEINELKRVYTPQNVDTIKFDNDYNKEIFDNNKKQYLMTWMELVFKYPRIAIDSYMISTLGYWYPNLRVWNTARDVFKNTLGIYQAPKGIKIINKLILRNDDLSKDVPLLNMFLSIGFGVWLVLFLLVFSMKKKQEKIVFFSPLIGIWITMMIASPVYGEYRYMYSFLTSLPVLGIVPYIEANNRKTKKKSKNKLVQQILRFGVVGGLAFLIDYISLIICKEVFGLNVLLSAAIAFTISVIFNYILSVKWVFDVNKEKSEKRNFILFIIFSIIGLILTEIIMWFGTDILKIHYLIVKIIATGIVMVFNFVTRKMFLE